MFYHHSSHLFSFYNGVENLDFCPAVTENGYLTKILTQSAVWKVKYGIK